MKSNKNSKGEWIIFFLYTSLIFVYFGFLLRDIADNSKRIENPSKELIEKVENKYLNGKLVDDFKVDDSIFNKQTPVEKRIAIFTGRTLKI